MPSSDSDYLQKVDDITRIRWTACSGFSGQLAPDSVVDFDRITQILRYARNDNNSVMLRSALCDETSGAS
jgi:hypothetical protein